MSEPLAGALWLSPTPAPRRSQQADDTLTADAAFRLAAEGTALIWRGDFQNARQLLQALGRRLDRREAKAPKLGAGGTARGNSRSTAARRVPGRGDAAPSPETSGPQFTQTHIDHPRGSADFIEPPDPAAFHRYRMQQAQRARLLGQLLIPVEPGYTIPLRRAPQVAEACQHALQCELERPALLPLRELLGIIGAWEWYRQGVPVPALGASIHPHYGVFAPVRGEYVDLVAQAPLPVPCATAWDLGCGTGVLAAVLARRGIGQILATDAAPRARACTRENLARLGLATQVTVLDAELFPPGHADLIVCNPPWLPGKAGSTLEQAVYDPDSRMLRSVLDGLAAHLHPGGEGWLLLSDLAERLGLRAPGQLQAWFDGAGLRVAGSLQTRPRHRRAADADDLFHAARAAEITTLWRLVPQ